MMPLDSDPIPLRILDAPESPALSVLVRCWNEMHALEEFWRSLRSQTVFHQLEIVVLDSGSTDGSLDFLLQQPCSLYGLPEGSFNFGRSCNQLAKLARSPRMLFLSAHVLLPQADAIARVVQLLDPQREIAAYLRQVPNPTFGFSPYEAAYLARRFPKGNKEEQLTQPAAFSNAASALTKAAWLRHRFPEIHGSEDHEWAKEQLTLGGQLFYLPQILAEHSHNETAEAVYRRVRLNAVARGETGAYGKAAIMLVGVFLQTLRMKAPVRVAWSYAKHHAKAYL